MKEGRETESYKSCWVFLTLYFSNDLFINLMQLLREGG